MNKATWNAESWKMFKTSRGHNMIEDIEYLIEKLRISV